MKKIFILISLFFTFQISFAQENQPSNKLIEAVNLQQDLIISSQKNQAIILMFSSELCPFCFTLAEELLQPMQIVQPGSNYLIRKVNMDTEGKMIDFLGNETTMAKFSSQHNIVVTPTLVFFNNFGVEQGKRIIGVNSIDLLSYYIDETIDQISNKIAQDKPSSNKTID